MRLSLHYLGLSVLCFASVAFGGNRSPFETPIDRHAVVARHAVHLTQVDAEAPVSVGNGDFAFTVDVTGLQSLSEVYYANGIPLETQSTWGWHSFPNEKGLRIEDAMRTSPFHGRQVKYAGLQNSPAGNYFRQNPHPIPLGQLGFLYQGRVLKTEELSKIDQTLDLWTGIVSSSFVLDGQPVQVETMADPVRSMIAVRVKSSLLAKGLLTLGLRFPYSYNFDVKNKSPMVWDRPEKHITKSEVVSAQELRLRRSLDESGYTVSLRWSGELQVKELRAHEFELKAPGETLTLTCAFAPRADTSPVPEFETVKAASIQGWSEYWTKGGAVDFSHCKDPRAAEIERRIVLSRYLTKVNYSGHFPPSEAGLTHISWYGKHNTEMFFWHAAQFYQWGHPELLERGLDWYLSILPSAKADAAFQGFDGARWPKMSSPEGKPAPGSINPYIIWNQPNPIYLSELVYRATPTRATLEKYKDLVFESAKFLAAFAFFDEASGRYVLGPPIKNVSEKAGENTTQNPTFELAYWHYGLQVAQAWRQRLGLDPEPHWADILKRLSPLPVSDGCYLEIETVPDTYTKGGALPTSMLMSLGYLPKTNCVDVEIIRKTFHEVNKRAKEGIQRWVSWSIGQGALTAARIGEPDTAVDILANQNPAARFMPSGHVRRPAEPIDCPAFLPVNSAYLCAAGLMIAGWDGAPKRNAPGFPKDDQWDVRWEGLNPMP